jgi:hypothetical protein
VGAKAGAHGEWSLSTVKGVGLQVQGLEIYIEAWVTWQGKSKVMLWKWVKKKDTNALTTPSLPCTRDLRFCNNLSVTNTITTSFSNNLVRGSFEKTQLTTEPLLALWFWVWAALILGWHPSRNEKYTSLSKSIQSQYSALRWGHEESTRKQFKLSCPSIVLSSSHLRLWIFE